LEEKRLIEDAEKGRTLKWFLEGYAHEAPTWVLVWCETKTCTSSPISVHVYIYDYLAIYVFLF